MIDGKGEIVLNGRSINEPYVMNFCPSKSKFNLCPPMTSTVPKGHVFVLGDNRANRWDSRFCPGGGLLPHNEIIRKTSCHFSTINRLGKLK